jgi:Protein of unknown function (DUF2975)
MKFKRPTKTEQILTVMNILAWVAFIGYAIEAGAILFSYGVSGINPEGAKNLYKGLNFYNLRQFNFWYYTCAVSFMVALSCMKSFVWYLVIKTLSKINLANPFKMEVAQTMERISYVLFGTWLVGMLSSAYTAWLMKQTGELFGNYVSGEFIFMAGLVFIISQIFKRGVEIQSENELTV